MAAAIERLRRLPFSYRLLILGAAVLTLLLLMLAVPRLAQPESYHNFADKRAFCGVPNFGDVASNLGFLAAGLAGLLMLWRLPQALPQPGWGARLPYLAYGAALVLVALGSAYYHWRPTTPSLYWDRLAMTVAFMTLAAAIVADRVDRRAGLALLPVLVLLGAAAATHWRQSELAGAGDLRLYFLVQFVPALVLPLIVLLFADRIGHDRYLVLMLMFYGAAIVLEQLDWQVFALLGGGVSGHSLKHLAAALGAYMVFHRLRVAARAA